MAGSLLRAYTYIIYIYIYISRDLTDNNYQLYVYRYTQLPTDDFLIAVRRK
jgi:hypothetical protein